MNWFKRLFRTEAPARVEPTIAPATKRPIKISEGALALAKSTGTVGPPKPVFTVPTRPPGIAQDAKLAMDGVAEAQSWANAALSSFWTEGVTFLGYAYLAELAQRPEYRVISETIATEMTRKWITFTSEDSDDDKSDRIKELEAEFKRLNVRDLFARATQQDGFFGRGHIYIDTDDTDDPKELEKSIGDGWDRLSRAKIKKGSIKALRTVEAVWCYPTSYNSNDPLKDDWYRPNTWYVQAKIVHSSRLLTFIGREVPDLLKPTYSFGGLSLSQMAKPYVDNWLETRQGVNDIISAFSVFVLATNLSASLEADGDQLFKRADLFNNLRNNRGLMMVDKDTEDFKNVAAPLGGLDALQAQAQEHMAAVSHIPTVKLLGIQPAGLNADSEGVMRSFYDYINSYQEHLYRDKIHRLMGLVMLHLWGETDDKIGFKFEPLWALDEKSQAEVRKLEAETGQILMDDGAISQEDERRRVASDPDTPYQGLDVDELPDLLGEEEEGLEPQGGRPQPIVEEEENADNSA
jgi:phage-related protein (TIGR01555 family)